MTERNHQQHHSTHHHHHHQHQRRPPDVEEALSSMLWTPYERTSTDSSSEDDDEKLNKRLRKSRSSYIYQPSIIAASAATAAAAAAPTTFMPMTTSYFGCDDFLLPVGAAMYGAATTPFATAAAATPFVPFTNLMISQTTNSASNGSQQHCYQQQQPPPATITTNNYHKHYDAASSANYRFSYPYYGPIPSLHKWWSSSATATVEPPSYDSLYAKNEMVHSSAMGLKPVLKNLKASIASISKQETEERSNIGNTCRNSVGADVTISTSRTHGNINDEGRRLVHSFTDDFIAENCSSSSAAMCQNTSSSSSHTNTSQINQQHYPQQHTKSTCHDQLHVVNNVDRHNAEQVACCSQTDVTTVTTKLKQMQRKPITNSAIYNCMSTNVVNKQQHISANNNYDDDEMERNMYVEQVNQPTSVADATKINEREASKTTTTTTTTRITKTLKTLNNTTKTTPACSAPSNSTTSKATSKQMNSNSPMHKTTTTVVRTGLTLGDSATISTTTTTIEQQQLYNDNDNSSSDNNSFTATAALSAVQSKGMTTAISSSRAFIECGSILTTTLASTTATVKQRTVLLGEKLRLSAKRARKTDTANNVNRVKNEQKELTPNKCLAELERLKAKLRSAGESEQEERRVVCNANAMRLNIPATVAVAGQTVTTTTQPTKIVPTTSSVFLTPSNVVVASNIHNNNNNNNKINNNFMNSSKISCNSNNNNINNNNNFHNVAILNTTTTTNLSSQQPSLTIQVNNNNNNNNNNNSAVVNAPTNTTTTTTPAHVYLNESIVNNNNGISVVNCSYVECQNGSVAKSSAVNSSSSNSNSVIGVSVNKNSERDREREGDRVFSKNSSSVPNVLNSSSNHTNAPNNLSSYPVECSENRPKNSSSQLVSVANATTITTTTISNRDSVNIINVNGPHAGLLQQQPQTIGNKSSSPATTSSTAPPSPTNISNNTSSNVSPTASPSRTFTSTQCQTDDIASVQMRAPYRHIANPSSPSAPPALTTREQRRRERRERRHQQQQLQQQLQHVVGANQLPPPSLLHHHHHHHQLPHIPSSRRHSERHSLPAAPPPPPASLHPHAAHFHHAAVPPNATMPAAMAAMLRPMLPDILHSHFPPPYSALGGGGGAHMATGPPAGPPARPPPPPPPPSTLLTPVISPLPIPGATTLVGDGRFTIPLPMIRRTPSERSGKGCCGQWFAGPPLRALIAVVALGGVACALGGAALGATGLAGPPSSHFTAALLMIGVGVVLVTVSGAAWRMTAPGGPPCLGLGSGVDLGRCGRRPCSRGGGAPHGLLYPEFQHRPPPPSYQASMQEYRLRLLLLDRDRQNGVVRGNSPPPTYRSHAGSLLRAPLTTTLRGGGGGSIGGSEYSLPPSYRSRNTTPGTICSERSIETAPSGRLLANEDIPEPLSAEQLPGYSSLQHLRQLSDLSATSLQIPKNTQIRAAAASTVAASATTSTSTATSTTSATSNIPVNNQLRTSAIVEVVSANKTAMNTDKFSSAPSLTSASVTNSNQKGKELVTIVTISQNHSDVQANEVENSAAERQQHQQPNEQMEILAHL